MWRLGLEWGVKLMGLQGEEEFVQGKTEPLSCVSAGSSPVGLGNSSVKDGGETGM